MGSLCQRHRITIVCHYTCIDAIVIQFADIAQNIQNTEILKHLSGHNSAAQRHGKGVRIERETTKEQYSAKRYDVRHRYQLRKDIHVG